MSRSSAGGLVLLVATLAAGMNGSLSTRVSESLADEGRLVCDKLASPRGSDAARGTSRRPYRTAKRLVNALRAGQTGCLRWGDYKGPLEITRRGTASRPITLRSYPGEPARVLGRILVSRRSAHFVMRGLYLDGRNRLGLPSPTVNGKDILFAANDVTNRRTGICFALGHPRYGVARRVSLRRNRIHHCGTLPATNQEHGVYISVARDTHVTGNWIYENADRGIQLFADAQRSRIRGNVIDSNGQGIIFGGNSRTASSDNLVEGNVISSSRVRYNVESFFEARDPVGSDNVVRRNCLGRAASGMAAGGLLQPPLGFETVHNVLARPSFRATHDYRLSPGPCTAVFAGRPAEIPGPGRRPPRLPRSER